MVATEKGVQSFDAGADAKTHLKHTGQGSQGPSLKTTRFDTEFMAKWTELHRGKTCYSLQSCQTGPVVPFQQVEGSKNYKIAKSKHIGIGKAK